MSFWQAKSHLILLLCYGTHLFEIKILISSVFAYCVQMMSSKSKQKLKLFDASKMNNIKHEIESENQHYAQDFNKQQFHHSYHHYLEYFSQRSSCSILIKITINDT